MNILSFPGLLPDLDRIPDQDRFFDTVKEDYMKYSRLGYFQPPGKAAFYVFRIRGPERQSTGLICTTHVEDYIQGRILKHEKTIHQKQEVQIKLLQEREAAVKPVLLVHRKETAIKQWLENFARDHHPVLRVEFPLEQETHLLWEVSEHSAMEEIHHLFRERLSAVAIADGHHRLSSFASLWQRHSGAEREPFAGVLSAYFPEDELDIAAFHRLVEMPPNLDVPTVLAQLQQLGEICPMAQPELPAGKHQMSIIAEGRWYHFTWHTTYLLPESTLHPLLDVDLLDRHILGPLLAIRDVQADSRLRYLEDIDRPEKLTEALAILPEGVTFALFPILAADFLQVAKLGLILVPKATFFRPRLKNGLIVQTIPVTKNRI